MKLTNSISERVKGWLGKYLNKRVKRYIFMVSLWSYIKDLDELDGETLRKLNEVLALRASEGSLYIPSLLGSVIWKDSLGNEVHSIQIENKPNIIETLLNDVPSWLKYDNREIIEKDLRLLVGNLSL